MPYHSHIHPAEIVETLSHMAAQGYNAFVVKYRAGKDNRGNNGGEMIGCCVYGIAAAIRFADGFSGGLIFLNSTC